MKKKKNNFPTVLNKGIKFLEELETLSTNIRVIIQAINRVQEYQQTEETIKKDDPYTILGVFPDDPIDVIKAVYKARVKFYHPDKGGNKEKFIEIDKAYRAILNDKKDTKKRG